MSAKLTWENDSQTMLCCTFEGEFGPENYGVMEGQLPMMIREVEHPVYLIFHLSHKASKPNLKGIMPETFIMLNIMPPNLQRIVGVGSGFLQTNPLSVGLADIFARRRFHGKVRIARSKNHARRLMVH